MADKQREHDAALQSVHDDVAVHIESGIRAAQKLFSTDAASSKKTIEKLSSELKVALARAECAESSLVSIRSEVQSKSCEASISLAVSNVSPALSSVDLKVELQKTSPVVSCAAPEARRRVLECEPAHIVDGPAERPKRRPLSAVDVNAAASSQPTKVQTHPRCLLLHVIRLVLLFAFSPRSFHLI
jgi:hypothetical protein